MLRSHIGFSGIPAPLTHRLVSEFHFSWFSFDMQSNYAGLYRVIAPLDLKMREVAVCCPDFLLSLLNLG